MDMWFIIIWVDLYLLVLWSYGSVVPVVLKGCVMFGNVNRCVAAMNEARGLPEVVVTREEFIAAMVATGVSEDEAGRQATISGILGSACAVGGRLLKIG